MLRGGKHGSVITTSDIDDRTYQSETLQQNETVLLLGEVKPNSATVIFSLWSTMIGSTLLLMPRITRDAGIFPSIGATVLMCISNTFTATLMIRLGDAYGMNTAAVLEQFGRAVHMFGVLVSVVVLLGACSIYHIYICDGVMKLASVPIDDMKYRPLFAVGIALVVFVVGLLKHLQPLFKAAGYAIVLVMLIVAFILVKAVLQFTDKKTDCVPSSSPLGMGWNGFGPFVENCAAMALSLYIHSLLLPILRCATRPEKNTRDLCVAFVATATSIAGPAALAAYAFRNCETISSDFLTMFDDWFTTVARCAVILLVAIVYPILLFNSRQQTIPILLQREDFPYWCHVLFNVVALVLCTIPCAIHAQTTIVATTLGVCAIMWVTLLPVAMHWAHVRRTDPERQTFLFIAVHAVLCLFGVGLIIVTLLSETTKILN